MNLFSDSSYETNKGTKLIKRKSRAIKAQETALTLNVQSLKFQVSARA